MIRRVCHMLRYRNLQVYRVKEPQRISYLVECVLNIHYCVVLEKPNSYTAKCYNYSIKCRANCTNKKHGA